MANALLEDLKWRGLVYQQTDEEGWRIIKESVKIYCGADPTADSLYKGIYYLFNFKKIPNHGHTPIVLVGGGQVWLVILLKNWERKLTDDQVEENVRGIMNQMHKILNLKAKMLQF